MKSWLTSVLAAVLVLVCAGCSAGGSSSTPAPSGSSSTPAPSGSGTSSRIPLATGSPRQADLEAILPSLITCMNGQGMSLAGGATGKQVRQAFRDLPLASQERVFTACEHLLPASARQTIANDLTAEKGMAT